MKRSISSAAWAVVVLVVMVAALMAAACQPVAPQGAPMASSAEDALPPPDPTADRERFSLLASLWLARLPVTHPLNTTTIPSRSMASTLS